MQNGVTACTVGFLSLSLAGKTALCDWPVHWNAEGWGDVAHFQQRDPSGTLTLVLASATRCPCPALTALPLWSLHVSLTTFGLKWVETDITTLEFRSPRQLGNASHFARRAKHCEKTLCALKQKAEKEKTTKQKQTQIAWLRLCLQSLNEGPVRRNPYITIYHQSTHALLVYF